MYAVASRFNLLLKNSASTPTSNSFCNSGCKSGFGATVGRPLVEVGLPPGFVNAFGFVDNTALVLYGVGNRADVPYPARNFKKLSAPCVFTPSNEVGINEIEAPGYNKERFACSSVEAQSLRADNVKNKKFP